MNKKHYKELSKMLLAAMALSATTMPSAVHADNLTNYPGASSKILKFDEKFTDFPDEIKGNSKYYRVNKPMKTITYTFPKNKIVQLTNGFGFNAVESSKHGEYKVIVNAQDIMVDNDGGFKVPEGVNLTINGDMHINGYSAKNRAIFPSGLGFSIGTGEGTRTRVIVKGTLDTTKFGTNDGYGLVDEFDRGLLGDNPGYKGARWLPTGIFGRSSHGSEIYVRNVDLRVRGQGVVSDPYYKHPGMDDYKLLTVNVMGGKIITPNKKESDFDNLAYYSLANFGGTININAYSNVEKPLTLNKNDVNMVGNIITIRDTNFTRPGAPPDAQTNPFFYRNGRTNINLNTPNSTWDGTIDNTGTEMAGEINLFLQNGAKWNNENMSVLDGIDVDNMPEPSRYKYGHYDGKAYLNTLVGGKTQEETGFITMNDKAPLIINKVSGYSKFIYQHNNQGDQAGDYTAGDVIVKAADENAHITLATPNNNIDTNNKDLVGKVLNTLAGKSTYANAGKDTNLAGKVEISEGLTASSASADLTKDIIFDATNGGKGKVDLPKTPEVQPPKEETKPDVQPPVVEPTPGGETQPEPPQPEPPQPAPEPEPEPEPSTPEVPAGEVLNLPPLNAANPDKAWAQYNDEGSVDIDEHPVNIVANNTATADESSVTGVLANKNDGSLSVAGADLNITATAEKSKRAYGIDSKVAESYNVNAENVNIAVTADTGRATGINIYDRNNQELRYLDLQGVNNLTKINVKARNQAIGIYAAGNTEIDVSNVDITKEGGWGVDVDKNPSIFSSHGIYAGNTYGTPQVGGTVKVSRGLKITSRGNGIMANGAGSNVLVENSSNPIYIEVSKEKGKNNYAIIAESGLVAVNTSPSGNLLAKENTGPVTIKGNLLLDKTAASERELDKTNTIILGLNNAQSSLTGLSLENFDESLLDGSSKKGKYILDTTIQLMNGATWNNENYGYSDGTDALPSNMKSYVTNLIGGSSKEKAGIINNNYEENTLIEKYSGNTYVNYKHDNSDPTKILGGGITVKSAEANSFMGLRTDNGGIDTSDAQSAVVRKVLTNLAGKLTYQGAIGNKENNLSGTVGIAEGLTASAATVKVEDVIKFNETTGVGELNQVAPPEEEHPPVSPTPGEEQPPVQPPTGEQNPPVEPPTGETTPPATGGDSGTGITPPTTGGESGSPEQPVPPTTGEGSGSQEQPVQPPAGEQPGTQPGGQPQQPPVVPSKPMAPPNINLGNYETAVMKSIRASQSVSVLALREMANDVTKRLGDLHFNQGDAGLWAKVESDKHNYDKRNVYGEYNGKAIHVGYDKKVNGNWLVGGQFTHLTGDTKYSDGKGDSSLNTIGLYGTKVNEKGSYVDIITKFGKLRNDYKVNTKEFNLAGKAKQNVQSFSVETGRRFTKDNGSFFEPQAELIYSHLPQADYYLTDGEHTLAVKQGSLDSLVARLGLAVGRKTDTSSIQAKLSIHNELLGTTSTVFKGENTKTVKYDYSGTWFTLGLAGTKQVSKGANIYGEITKAFGGGYSKAWNINLGARWMF